MGKKSRTKGQTFEREVVNAMKAAGFDAERVPLSGAAKGSFGNDVRICGLEMECKIRANGFKELYAWIERDAADGLVIRADRKPRLYVLSEASFMALLHWGCPRTIHVSETFAGERPAVREAAE